MASAIWWLVIGVAGYLIVTRTTLLQSLTQKVQAQTMMPVAMDMSGASAMMPMAMMNSTSMNVTPMVSNVNAVVPAANNNQSAPAASNKAPKMKAARNNNMKNMMMASMNNNAAAASGMFTTGSGQSLKSTVNNAALIAMGVSSAGCPAGGVRSGGRNCYTLPGRHHCCPGKPSPAGSPSNAAGQTPCECDV